jgi:predicted nucleic acid-binding protein
VILADTSVWIDHFRATIPELQNLLAGKQVAMHPFVIAELALGSLRDRARTLLYLDMLPSARVARLIEVRQIIEVRAMHSKGIGLIDTHLVASCLLSPGTQLWTRDAALENMAAGLGIAFSPAKIGGTAP